MRSTGKERKRKTEPQDSLGVQGVQGVQEVRKWDRKFICDRLVWFTSWNEARNSLLLGSRLQLNTYNSRQFVTQCSLASCSFYPIDSQ